ncbi:30S ribosomal protein S5 [Candidatus Peregrinibacteria bacterium]|nr:30S ribosomal protein S5 [Candidatus Peregrinibacteria bacterium]
MREVEKKEFDDEVLQIDRVTRVVKGGRRLRFRVTVAIGDRRGRVGMGIGKAAEVSKAVQKAVASAKKRLIRVPINKNDSIPHDVKIKYKAARMVMFPALPGTGVIAGGTLRKILELAGVKNVLSKNYGTSNRVVTTQAVMRALQNLRPVAPKDQKKHEEKKAPVSDMTKKPFQNRSSKKPLSSKKDTSETPAAPKIAE